MGVLTDKLDFLTQNTRAKKAALVAAHRMRVSGNIPEAKPRRLFHGTSESAKKDIDIHGFSSRISSKRGTPLNPIPGVYFSKDPKYAAGYAHEDNIPEGERGAIISARPAKGTRILDIRSPKQVARGNAASRRDIGAIPDQGYSVWAGRRVAKDIAKERDRLMGEGYKGRPVSRRAAKRLARRSLIKPPGSWDGRFDLDTTNELVRNRMDMFGAHAVKWHNPTDDHSEIVALEPQRMIPTQMPGGKPKPKPKPKPGLAVARSITKMIESPTPPIPGIARVRRFRS